METLILFRQLFCAHAEKSEYWLFRPKTAVCGQWILIPAAGCTTRIKEIIFLVVLVYLLVVPAHSLVLRPKFDPSGNWSLTLAVFYNRFTPDSRTMNTESPTLDMLSLHASEQGHIQKYTIPSSLRSNFFHAYHCITWFLHNGHRLTHQQLT